MPLICIKNEITLPLNTKINLEQVEYVINMLLNSKEELENNNSAKGEVV